MGFALGVALTLAAATARAETSYPECAVEPAPEAVEAAQGAFKAGKAAFDEADYQRAINYWLDAYRRDCRAHDLLLNLARAYELRGDKTEAIHALKTYLERKPETSQREQFERRIANLEEPLSAEPTEATALTEASPSLPSEGERPVVSSPPPEPPPAPVEERGRKPFAPLIVAGVGGVVAVVGGVLWVGAHRETSDHVDECGQDRDGCPGTADEANDSLRMERMWGGLAIGGVVVGAAGTIWFAAAPRKPKNRTERSQVSPIIGPSFIGAAVTGRF
ncbi:MAG: hypothetical protein JW751_28105 [Polyangiaceae bacterium]|nr:hypothetical protein [Polyangiaceae bacterium]